MELGPSLHSAMMKRWIQIYFSRLLLLFIRNMHLYQFHTRQLGGLLLMNPHVSMGDLALDRAEK